MGLNKSKGNMYEFITHTWNTVKGECYHDCSYCYMKRWGALRPVRFDTKELKANLGEGKFIFVGSSCDMFAENIPDEWISQTLRHCEKFDGNKYLFQTKNPKRVLQFKLPNAVVCTTLESDVFYADIMRNSPTPEERAFFMEMLWYHGIQTFVTIEPIMDFNLTPFVELIKKCRPKQVNIGADSSRNNLPEPCESKVLELIEELRIFTDVHNKKNLQRLQCQC